MKNITLCAVGVALFASISYPTSLNAQVPCGSIIAPEYLTDFATNHIENCGDPFGVTPGVQSPYTLRIDDQIVTENMTVLVEEGGTQNYTIEGDSLIAGYNNAIHIFFLHDGDTYRFYDITPSEADESDYRAFAREFFGASADIELYVAAAFDAGLLDNSDEDTKAQFWEFIEYVDQHFVPQVPVLKTGTYTLVIVDYELMLNEESLFKKLFAKLVSTAYAQEYSEYTFALTFTIKETPPVPGGASSVLFLPGIQASRLYTEVDGKEEKLWEPGGDDDIERLRMNDEGESIFDVYTKEVIDQKGDVAIGGNIYKGFLEYLDEMDGDTGPVVRAFPYDWRQSVFDIVEYGTKDDNGLLKKPVETIKYLAALSPTKKTTIIAHSNGGLLAKAIMLKLAEEGKTNLVDKVIFIATPHIGTPKDIAALLHGYDQELLSGLLANDEKVRDVMQNMPGVYGLIPSEAYLDSLTEPLISFDDSETTKIFRDAYGFTLTNMDEYTGFLKGTEGRTGAGNRINEAGTANGTMLDEALNAHRELLDTWTAPEGVEVFNIVGTGLPTPKSIEYQEFMSENCDEYGFVCTPKPKIEGVLRFTNYGDETVVSKSASSLFSESTKYIDLSLAEKHEHANITEAETTKMLIDHILHGSSTDSIAFTSNTEPTFETDTHIYTIHSPARIYLRDTEGNITGKTEIGGEWKSEIPGSDYFEAGGVKYLLVPGDSSHTVTIEGEDTGVFTHTLTTLHNETESVHHTFTASATPSLVLTYQKTGETFSTVTVDKNGDGISENEMTLDGKIIEKVISYADLNTAIRTLSLSKIHKTALLTLAAQAEKLSKQRNKKINRIVENALLFVMQVQVEQYAKKGLITETQKIQLKHIINKLISQ